jgi:hypothetical protein
MFALDKNIWDGSLSSLLCKIVLNCIPIITLVKLNSRKLNSFRLQQALYTFAVGAVALAEDHSGSRGD